MVERPQIEAQTRQFGAIVFVRNGFASVTTVITNRQVDAHEKTLALAFVI